VWLSLAINVRDIYIVDHPEYQIALQYVYNARTMGGKGAKVEVLY